MYFVAGHRADIGIAAVNVVWAVIHVLLTVFYPIDGDFVAFSLALDGRAADNIIIDVIHYVCFNIFCWVIDLDLVIGHVLIDSNAAGRPAD